MHLFHKWVYLQKKTTKEFLGEEYEAVVEAGIRICKVCKKTQKEIDTGKSFSWVDLNTQETVILGKKLSSKEVFKKEVKNENPTTTKMG